ncbi:MAG TPA: malonyl-ACP O-methyltransferase BioC [Steroidobacteraceae bacterium]|nr:malonyl-ACP O-methyltransferase BioC [Steroidobacteraceae bacterium]
MSPPADTFQLDKAGVRAAFDRAGPTYEATAVLQARVAEELLSRLEPFDFHPGIILDLGAGTGRLTAELKKRYRRALVIALDLAPGMLREAGRHQRFLRRFERVCADAARLPLETGSVDIVFSNLMLQWCEPLDDALAEVRRVLKPQGFFLFSTFGPDTLRELRSAWAEVDSYNHVNRFLDMHDVGDALVRAGLLEPVLDVERLQVTYDDALSLMRDLKAIGARNATAGRARSLAGRARLQRVLAAYESFRRDGRLPATYEVVYGAAWGEQPKAASARAGSPGRGVSPESASPGKAGTPVEVAIPPSAIQRRKR